jgi:hypothetical protein
MKWIMTRIIILGIIIFGFTRCNDPELDAMMEDYCDCISKSRYDESLHMECLEKMDSIQEKYKNQPRKLNMVLEKTDQCY